jgi:hypothetical protein
MRYGVSFSKDYFDNGAVVIRDFKSIPQGRILAIIPRENKKEAEIEAQTICDLLNNEERLKDRK